MKAPDRWFNYSCFNKPINGTRIIATKTPLKDRFNTGLTNEEMTRRGIEDGVPLEKEFTPTQLIERLRSKGLKLGHVIDLTNTQRYYDSYMFTSHGVCYDKIFCEGHEIPSESVYTNFKQILSTFLSDNTEDVIAVHCTHGVNRTGYLVCRYLIDCCGYQPDKAIESFNEARGHAIERDNYLDHLRQGDGNHARGRKTEMRREPLSNRRRSRSPIERRGNRTYYDTRRPPPYYHHSHRYHYDSDERRGEEQSSFRGHPYWRRHYDDVEDTYYKRRYTTDRYHERRGFMSSDPFFRHDRLREGHRSQAYSNWCPPPPH